ncbi:cell division protein FtsL [Paracoccus sp. DMF]|uniref:cell division protein FtsL n=1 Tax=Paracoccus sp. DMF TaxID=400837 RepID=UPI001104ED4B|nr:cell division protein FtsL [Paracoccus sp. DMF]MCV2447346.1 cell division protein FtsL [Paracoccus sp. DMF]
MRSVLYLLTTLVVMGLAFWAYRENYRTQAAIGEMSEIQRQIGHLREELGVMRAEWAFLNRPERLRQLVNLNFDKLKLVPFGSDQFVDVGQVAFPTPKAPAPPPGADMPIERPAGYPPRRPQESTP